MPNTPYFRAARRADAEALITLTKRRTWYADEQDAQPNTPPSGGAPDGALNNWRMEDLHPGVQEYIRQLRGEAADQRKALTAAQAAAAQREQAQLAEQGKFKELAEARAAELAKLQPYQQRAEALERLITAGNQARIQQVREDMRALIPTDYAPEALSVWLDKNWALLQPKPAPSLDAGAGGGGKPQIQVTEQDRTAAAAAAAAGYPVTAEQIAERRLKRGQ